MSTLLLEGGGSHSFAALTDYADAAFTATMSAGSTNPRSVGLQAAKNTLISIFAALAPFESGEMNAIVAVHGAASTRGAATEFALTLDTVRAEFGWRPVPITVTNDLTPLLYSHHEHPVVVAVAGTGTGFAARHGNRVARASGYEWLLSDEGGGHDLAIQGLRAVVRAHDGRGETTALTHAAAEWMDTTDEQLPAALFDLYGASPQGKALIARFAENVLAAAEAGDTVATRLVDDAAIELATGVQAVYRRTTTTGTPTNVVMDGSLLTSSAQLRAATLQHLTRLNVLLLRVAIVDDDYRAAALLGFLRQLRADRGISAAIAESIPTYTLTPTRPGRL